jgi:hypothetical protein
MSVGNYAEETKFNLNFKDDFLIIKRLRPEHTHVPDLMDLEAVGKRTKGMTVRKMIQGADKLHFLDFGNGYVGVLLSKRKKWNAKPYHIYAFSCAQLRWKSDASTPPPVPW